MDDLIDKLECVKDRNSYIITKHLHRVLYNAFHLVHNIAEPYYVDPSDHNFMRDRYCLLDCKNIVNSFVKEKWALKDHLYKND